MKKIFWIVSVLLFSIAFIILIIALTNNSPSNQLKEYRLTIGLGILLMVSIFRIIYRMIYK